MIPFDSLSPNAKTLLDQARQVANDTPLSVFHVFYVELRLLERHVRPEADVPTLTRLAANGTALATLRGTLLGIMRTRRDTDVTDDNVTKELHNCLVQARAKAGDLPVTDAMILAAILAGMGSDSRDALAQSVQWAGQDDAAANVDLAALYQELQRAFPVANGGDGGTLHFRAQLVPQSADGKYGRRHQQWTLPTVRGLAETQPPGIVLAIGEYGSPLDVLEEALADLIGTGTYSGSDASRIGEYGDVLQSNVATLMANEPTRVAAAFRALVRHAADVHAVLSLKRLELLERDTEASRQLRQALADPGDEPLLGIFECTRGQARTPAALFPILGPAAANATIIDIPCYNEARTLRVLEAYHVPEWREQGYQLAPDALNILFALEPGVEVMGRHRGMPYLAVGVVKEVIDTLNMRSGRDEFIHDMAALALMRLEELLRDGAQRPSAATFVAALTDARTVLQELASPPRSARAEVQRADKVKTITRPLVTAHVLGSATMQFRFPGTRSSNGGHTGPGPIIAN